MLAPISPSTRRPCSGRKLGGRCNGSGAGRTGIWQGTASPCLSQHLRRRRSRGAASLLGGVHCSVAHTTAPSPPTPGPQGGPTSLASKRWTSRPPPLLAATFPLPGHTEHGGRYATAPGAPHQTRPSTHRDWHGPQAQRCPPGPCSADGGRQGLGGIHSGTPEWSARLCGANNRTAPRRTTWCLST
jgi:hypothetical protein